MAQTDAAQRQPARPYRIHVTGNRIGRGACTSMEAILRRIHELRKQKGPRK